MKIQSGRLGAIDIDPAQIYTFIDGIIGFPDFKRYVALTFLDDSPLLLLQAVDEPNLAFIVVDPLAFLADYTVEVPPEDLAGLKATAIDELSVVTIVTIPEDPYMMTANLQGPILLNPTARLAKQIVNGPGRYPTKHPVIAAPPAPANADERH